MYKNSLVFGCLIDALRRKKKRSVKTRMRAPERERDIVCLQQS